jgi:hypothetical protein
MLVITQIAWAVRAVSVKTNTPPPINQPTRSHRFIITVSPRAESDPQVSRADVAENKRAKPFGGV